MHLLPSLTAVAIFALHASAVPLDARQTELKPFEVTRVVTSTPPGRPGSTPWRYITADITDPNSYFLTQGPHNLTIPAGSQGIGCEARWYRGESPEGRTWPCNAAENGHWALQVLPGTSGSASSTSDFKLRFVHAVEPGTPYDNTRYEAEASFKTGDNLSGRCLSSGGCNYGLSSAAKPVLAPAQKTL